MSAAQKPMTVLVRETLEYIWKHDSIRADRVEKKVVKRLLNRELVKRVRTSTGSRSTIMLVATAPAPTVEEPKTEGPYAKRKALLEATGVSYRGKTWGKKRVDLPREERERKIAEKQEMWKKLKRPADK